MDDAELNESFMVKTKMTAAWTFTFRDTDGGKPLEWHRKATGKSITQFTPAEGSLEVGFRWAFGDDETEALTHECVSRADHDVLSRLFALEELVLVGVSAAIALVSGLVLYYSPNVSFGSMQDYLALFTWGVGVEQGKNLVQTFQSLSSQRQ
jgi:hypothetical protein